MSTMDMNKNAPLSDITEQPQVCVFCRTLPKANSQTNRHILIGARIREVREISP